jgi:purine-nucleoside/S-methyl-5'-thioadenosine phosphorylase / adenosine deaminase
MKLATVRDRAKPCAEKNANPRTTDAKNISRVAVTVPHANAYNAVMAFSIRTGGQSPPPLNSLNFSVAQGDSQENVRGNLSVLCSSIGISPAGVAMCIQVHSDDIAVIDEVPSSLHRVDAIVSLRPGVFPAIRTADCVPILLLDPVNKISAAVHAGWRGTVLGITGKVVRLMTEEYATDPANLIASLGPAIGPCCYEVDDAVLAPFRKGVTNAENFIRVVKTNCGSLSGKSYRLDLAAANRAELMAGGVPGENIHTICLCTKCNPSLFFSFRRDGARSGRHIAVVGFRDGIS